MHTQTNRTPAPFGHLLPTTETALRQAKARNGRRHPKLDAGHYGRLTPLERQLLSEQCDADFYAGGLGLARSCDSRVGA